MKRFIMVCALSMCLAPAGVALAQDDDGDVGRIFIAKVKHGQGEALRAGIKAHNDCYGEHGGEHAWDTWVAETGKLGRYAFTTGGRKWAMFDEREEADEACDEVFAEQFLPHIDKATSEFTRFMAEHSHMGEGEYNLAWVINFKVKDARRFLGAMAQIAAAAKATEWENNYAFYDVVAGGSSAADFFVVVLNENFGGLDAENPGLFEMVAAHHGEEAAERIRTDLRDSIQDDWSDMWRRVPDLSYRPAD